MIAIVGHGPSLKGKKLGKEIDSCDKVVRLKGSNTILGNDDYGNEVDALVASTEIMGTFFKMDAPEYWAYPKKGFYDERSAIMVIERLQKPVMIPIGICNFWNNRFKQMNASHPNYSTGMAAIIISIHRWSPKKIKLYGFDTMLNPEIEFSRNDDIPRSGVGKITHDWEKENQLLKLLSDMYKVEIC